MYSRNYQGSEERRRRSVPLGYRGAEELRGSLLVPPDYHGEFLRRVPATPVGESQNATEAMPKADAHSGAEHNNATQMPYMGAVPPVQKRAAYHSHTPQTEEVTTESEDAFPIEEESESETREVHTNGLLSELSSLLFGRGGEEDALLILGVGLLLMNSRMERGKTPLFSGGRLHTEEDDIGLFLILLLLFS